MARAVDPQSRIHDWLAAHPDGKRWDALLAWVKAVSIDHEMVTCVIYVKPGTTREVRTSHIPVACTCAVFIVVNSPVFAIHIIEFNDEMYDPTQHHPR